MQKDLTFGIDVRGDEAFFIETRHFSPTGDLDEEAKTALGSRTEFFRVLDDGEEQHSHGWIENGEVVQWG